MGEGDEDEEEGGDGDGGGLTLRGAERAVVRFREDEDGDGKGGWEILWEDEEEDEKEEGGKGGGVSRVEKERRGRVKKIRGGLKVSLERKWVEETNTNTNTDRGGDT